MFDRAGVHSFQGPVYTGVYERREGPTGIRNQIVFRQSDAVLKTAMAVGRVDQGVEWETLGEGIQGICYVCRQ